jgi:hypothetical protein
MAEQTIITNGTTEQLVNTEQSRRERDDELDRVVFLIHVENAVRFRESENDNEGTNYARTGVPISGGTTFDYEPRGAAVYMHADGADATVHVQEMHGRIGDFE